MTVLVERPSATEDEHEPVEPEELLDSLELPPGYKAELIEGNIVVTPPPGTEHEGYFVETTYQFNAQGWRVSGNTGLLTPLGRFTPDLTVARRGFFSRDEPDGWRRSDGVALVAEITSSDPTHDRDSKRRGYAAAKIPLYLLIDRKAKEAVLFSEPARGDYAAVARRPIDEPIPLPEPFSFTLEDILA